MCGNEIPIKVYRTLHALRCHDSVESQYYGAGSTRGGRVVTELVCCICYTTEDIAPFDEVKRCQKQAVKKPLPCCRTCLKLNIKLPGGGTDYSLRKVKTKAKKKKQTADAIASGRKKNTGQSYANPTERRAGKRGRGGR